MTRLTIGMAVKIPAHRLSGAIATMWGLAPDRRVSIETPDGTIVTVAEAEIECAASEPAAQPPPQQPTGLDLVMFARDLARRTAQSTSDECRALNGLARAYLVCQGRRL